MYTRKIYEKNIQGPQSERARYLLITLLLQLHKIHTISLNSYPCHILESSLAALEKIQGGPTDVFACNL